MRKDEEAVSLFAVPISSKNKRKLDTHEQESDKNANSIKKPSDKEDPSVYLLNELGIPSGKFGWCVACRGTANLYCKHTRHPVCSFECK